MPATPVGRLPELAATAAFLADAALHPAALLIEGEPGIGKSTVWAAGVDEARARGFRVLRAGPTEAEMSLSYAVLADLLGLVEPAVLNALPEPQRRAVDGVLMRSGTADTDGRAVAAALLGVLERLAERGPVLVAGRSSRPGSCPHSRC